MTVSSKQGPTRRCIISGAEAPAETLVRFVVDPDGNLIPDIAAKLPGRGLWLRPDRDMIRVARDKGAFSRSARRNVNVPADLADRVEVLLRRQCLGLIGLARRSRQLFVGFEKVRAAMASGQVGILLAAHDGSLDGRSKVARMAPDVPVCETFSASELGRAVGSERVVHAAIAAGRFCERFLAEVARLDGMCASPGIAMARETNMVAGRRQE